MSKAKCPDCGEVFEYSAKDKDTIFDEFGRFRAIDLEYVYKRYHTCGKQTTLETFK